MENLEQKSESSSISTEAKPVEVPVKVTNNISIEPLAQQFQAYLPLSYAELRSAFDEYWVKNMDGLMAQLPKPKLKKHKGGGFDPAEAQKIMEKTYKVNKLYRSVLLDTFVKKMEEYRGKGCVLFVNSLELISFNEGEECPLVSIFYFKPELSFDGEVDFKCKRPKHVIWEDYWAGYAERLQKSHKILTPDDGPDIHENHSVLMDIAASCEGKAEESLSCRLKWFEMPYFRPESLKEEVLRHKRGDLFETTFVVEDPTGNKEVKAQVKIHELQTITLPAIDDDLAKTAKADSLEILKATEKVKFEEYHLNADKSTVVDHVITTMLQKSKVPPAPMSWMDTNAKRIMGEHVSKYADAAKAAQALGCVDEDAMLDAFRSQINRDYIQDLVLHKYAQIFDIEFDLSKIFDHMLSKVEWLEESK